MRPPCVAIRWSAGLACRRAARAAAAGPAPPRRHRSARRPRHAAADAQPWRSCAGRRPETPNVAPCRPRPGGSGRRAAPGAGRSSRRGPSTPGPSRPGGRRRPTRRPAPSAPAWRRAGAPRPRAAGTSPARRCHRPRLSGGRRRWRRWRRRCRAPPPAGRAGPPPSRGTVRHAPWTRPWRRRSGCGRGRSSRARPRRPSPRPRGPRPGRGRSASGG